MTMTPRTMPHGMGLPARATALRLADPPLPLGLLPPLLAPLLFVPLDMRAPDLASDRERHTAAAKCKEPACGVSVRDLRRGTRPGPAGSSRRAAGRPRRT